MRRGEVYGLQWDISIHAPPRGATVSRKLNAHTE